MDQLVHVSMSAEVGKLFKNKCSKRIAEKKVLKIAQNCSKLLKSVEKKLLKIAQFCSKLLKIAQKVLNFAQKMLNFAQKVLKNAQNQKNCSKLLKTAQNCRAPT